MKKIEIDQYFHIGAVIRYWGDVGATLPANSYVAEENREQLLKSLPAMKGWCSALAMDGTVGLIDRVVERIKADPKIKWIAISTFFDSLNTVARSEMAKVFAGFISAELAKYWGLEKPFGDLVYENFPSARQDAKAAGCCRAVEQYDACIFHLMRVAEKGLLLLAKDRKVKLIHSAPVAWSEWQKIISAVETEAKKITNTASRGTKKDKALEFYSGALGELISFKDTYRNFVMHGRETYDIHQSASAYDRVSDFMKRLSARLSEVKK